MQSDLGHWARWHVPVYCMLENTYTRTHVKKYPYLSKCNYKKTVATRMNVCTYIRM